MRQLGRLLTLAGVLLIGLGPMAKAQDPHFSQYYTTALYLNPALAGLETDLAFTGTYRVQWRSVTTPFISNQVSMIAPITFGEVEKNQIGSFGLSVYNDRAGDGNLKTIGANATFAYNIYGANKLNLFSFGAQAGFMQKSIDFTNLEWGEMFDPFLGVNTSITPDIRNLNNSVLYPDVQAGVLYAHNPNKDWSRKGISYFVGASGYHLTQPNESLIEGETSQLPTILKGHGGLMIHLNEKFNVQPAFLAMFQNGLTQFNVGSYLTYRIFEGPVGPKQIFADSDITFGAYHRFDDSFILSMGFSNKTYSFAFSYDLNTSSLRYQTSGRGAYEFSLTFRSGKEEERRRYDTPRI